MLLKISCWISSAIKANTAINAIIKIEPLAIAVAVVVVTVAVTVPYLRGDFISGS